MTLLLSSPLRLALVVSFTIIIIIIVIIITIRYNVQVVERHIGGTCQVL